MMESLLGILDCDKEKYEGVKKSDGEFTKKKIF